MYFNPNNKWHSFTYKNQSYVSGTRVVYNGKCYLNECEVELNDKTVTFLYTQHNKTFFNDGDILLTCPSWEFSNRIITIIDPNSKTRSIQKENEFYWTDDMVIKTIWYVLIMLAAVVCNGRIFIWILSTMVWYDSVFNNKK